LYYLGNKYEVPFTLALEALGLPIVQCMDEKSTAAMWTYANVNYMQQRIIKKHLRLHFGKHVLNRNLT
jgi:leucyl-tRNA synthetase